MEKKIGDNAAWTPNQLLNESDNKSYVLHSADIRSLMQYVWTGCLRPTSRSALAQSLGFREEDLTSDLWPDVDKVIAEYATVQADTTKFRDSTYQAMIDLSTKIRTYAISAGGKGTESYQGKMLQYAQQFQQAVKNGDDQSTIDSLAEKIKALVRAEKKQIKGMDETCGNIKDDVGSFRTATITSAVNLTKLNGVLKDDLNRAGGLKDRVEHLQEEINGLKNQYDADEKELKKDRAIRDGAYGYIWIPMWGTIAGATVLGIYNDKINKIKNDMETILKKIQKDTSELNADLIVISDLTSISSDVTALVSLVDAATSTLNKIQGQLQSFQASLDTLETFVDNSGEHYDDQDLEGLDLDMIQDEWVTLYSEVDEFIKVAYIAQPDLKDLAGALQDLDSYGK